MGICVSRHWKEELAWAKDKQLGIISNNYNVIWNSYTTRKLKNKAVLSLNNIPCIAMWSLVMYFNCLVIYISPTDASCIAPPLRYLVCLAPFNIVNVMCIYKQLHYALCNFWLWDSYFWTNVIWLFDIVTCSSNCKST